MDMESLIATTIEQSKLLAKILPIESADMYHLYQGQNDKGDKFYTLDCHGWDIDVTEEDIPAWSLSALMNCLPKGEGIEIGLTFGYYQPEGEWVGEWVCCYETEGDYTDNYVLETTTAKEQVDACVAMIEKLHELNLL